MFLGTTVAIVITLCILAVSYLIQVLTARKVSKPNRLLIMMTLLAPIFQIRDVLSDRSRSGFYRYTVGGCLVTTVAISLSRSMAISVPHEPKYLSTWRRCRVESLTLSWYIFNASDA